MPADPSDTIQLTVPVAVGGMADEVVIEPGLLERLFRIAAFAAVRDGLLAPGEEVAARLVPGPIRARHGDVHCLERCRVELRRGEHEVVTRIDFDREAFLAFALARATHRLAAEASGAASVSYALHGFGCDEPPAPVAVPSLRALSVDAWAAHALPWGTPSHDWIATFMAPAVARGLGALEETSRRSGVEAAGRLHTRIGFDPVRRCFVRVLERLVPVRGVPATARTVRSTAGSWGEFLSTRPVDAPSVASSVHSHVHLDAGQDAAATPAPCISVDDLVTHYVNFPDPLSAALIVSVFPDAAEVRLYGYTPGAVLREEPGWWMLTEDDHAQ